MRQVVLDTETTGLESKLGHRIIEIGCVELINRRASGRQFHRYLNPERDIDHGAIAVHGITREQLMTAPKFAAVVEELLEFIRDSELIIHNAAFDVEFLDMELGRLALPALPASVGAICRILDTLTVARARHPGQRNNLDALCKRYGIDNSHRELHGALLDARILADVYLAMTGGQSSLALDEVDRGLGIQAQWSGDTTGVRPAEPLRVVLASEAERVAHAQLTQLLQKASGGKCVWLRLEPPIEPVTTSPAGIPAMA
jgi:DNA polymerase-3 subunit epsilon